MEEIKKCLLTYYSFLLVLTLILKNNCGVYSKVYDKHEFELTQSINIQRQELVQKMCINYGLADESLEDLNLEQMEHMLVDKKHKFMYCYVPKVACTNWKRVLMMMTDQWNGTDPLQIPASLAHSNGMFVKLKDLSDDEKLEVLTDYTRFIIVRHPLERLLSAFRNKLQGDLPSSKYFQARVGRQIIKYFRTNPSNESLLQGHDVTFGEFVQYLLSPEMNQTFNEHWESVSRLCNPCAMKYNVIGKYETLIDDSALALNMAGISNINFPAGQKTSGTSDLLGKYFDVLPNRITANLYKLYEQDFRIFGYSLEDVLGFELG